MICDGLILGYLNAYNRDASIPLAEYDEELHRMAGLLIKLAIIVMADYVA